LPAAAAQVSVYPELPIDEQLRVVLWAEDLIVLKRNILGPAKQVVRGI
jgi:hypothetical protein